LSLEEKKYFYKQEIIKRLFVGYKGKKENKKKSIYIAPLYSV